MSSSPTVGGYLPSFFKTVDASLHTFHVCQADFFPLPQNADNVTTSEGMEVKDSTSLLWTNCRNYVMYWNPFQMFSLAKGNPQLLQAKFLQVWQNRYYYYYNICVICLNHEDLVALHYCMLRMYKYTCICLFTTTWSQMVQIDHLSAECQFFLCHMTTFIVCISAILSARKWKSSDLFSSRRKLCHFFGILLPPAILLLTPFPRFDLVSDFKLDGKYTRQHQFSCIWQKNLV